MPLIVFEGIDGSGKTVQVKLLAEKLRLASVPFRELDFPRYDKSSSSLVKEYLAGNFGTEKCALGPYVVSTFYAADRIISYHEDWKEAHRNSEVIISNRYTTSNMIHHGASFDNQKEQCRFFEWIQSLEYDTFNLPEPDMVILLYMQPEISKKLRDHGSRTRDGDIHENDDNHLEAAWEASIMAANYYHWDIIRCVSSGNLRSENDIHEEVVELINKRFHLF